MVSEVLNLSRGRVEIWKKPRFSIFFDMGVSWFSIVLDFKCLTCASLLSLNTLTKKAEHRSFRCQSQASWPIFTRYVQEPSFWFAVGPQCFQAHLHKNYHVFMNSNILYIYIPIPTFKQIRILNAYIYIFIHTRKLQRAWSQRDPELPVFQRLFL